MGKARNRDRPKVWADLNPLEPAANHARIVCAVDTDKPRPEKAAPFVPTEIHVWMVADENGALGILSIRTTEGILEIALDR